MIISVYNHWKHDYEIELFPGEEICPICKGSGIREKVLNKYGLQSRCKKCSGEGKIDWVTKAMRNL